MTTIQGVKFEGEAVAPALPRDIQTDEMVFNMGPQHPSTHGVLRVVVKTDGEVVLDCHPLIGNLHRCAEKILENVTYVQGMPYVDRMDYLGALNNEMGLALAAVLSRAMATAFFQVDPWDKPIFILVAVLLSATGLLATFIPARRATRVDPMVALRYE